MEHTEETVVKKTTVAILNPGIRATHPGTGSMIYALGIFLVGWVDAPFLVTAVFRAVLGSIEVFDLAVPAETSWHVV